MICYILDTIKNMCNKFQINRTNSFRSDGSSFGPLDSFQPPCSFGPLEKNQVLIWLYTSRSVLSGTWLGLETGPRIDSDFKVPEYSGTQTALTINQYFSYIGIEMSNSIVRATSSRSPARTAMAFKLC